MHAQVAACVCGTPDSKGCTRITNTIMITLHAMTVQEYDLGGLLLRMT